MRTLAVIPARGGSERIPGKNIRSFCGKPMISYIIGAALGEFDDVVVSTDSRIIKAVAESYGASVPFVRPAGLAGSQIGMCPVVYHAMEEMTKIRGEYTHVGLLYACAPMVESEDLRRAILLCQQNDCATLAVSKYTTPVDHRLYINAEGFVVPNSVKAMQMRTQDLPEAYFDAAQFSVYPIRVLRERKSLDWAFSAKMVPYILPSYKAVDIDTEEDWVRAELAYAAYKGETK